MWEWEIEGARAGKTRAARGALGTFQDSAPRQRLVRTAPKGLGLETYREDMGSMLQSSRSVSSQGPVFHHRMPGVAEV